ncbi:MAG: hypothetical protein JXR97_14385 [Planctomycetes bacterium]|nr:hypothetical protein [Planctomycetota bacterium]
MRHYRQVIFGGSCWAIGSLLAAGEGEVLLVERSASLGGEYFDSYRRSEGWDAPLDSAIAANFRKEMGLRNMLRGDATDFYGLLPAIYNRLGANTDNIMMMSELAGVTKITGGYELELYNHSGRNVICCDEIIDSTPTAVTRPDFGKDSIKGKRLNGSVLVSEGVDFFSHKISGLDLRPGRSGQEAFISAAVAPESGWVEARKQLADAWLARPAELRDCLVRAIAKEFEYAHKCEHYEIDENWTWINASIYSNPLLAIDAGVGAVKSGRGAEHVSC